MWDLTKRCARTWLMPVCGAQAELLDRSPPTCVLPRLGACSLPQRGRCGLPCLPQRHRRCVLLIAGDGSLQPSLWALAHKLGIERAVRFLGFRRDVSDLLAIVDVLVIPSYFEAFPVVAIEGMASGTPVVASRAGGLVESIVDGVTGRLVAVGDSADLAAAILEVLADPDRAAAMGLAGKERVQRCFSGQVMLAKHEQLYKRLLSG